jgi:hypothetical protein
MHARTMHITRWTCSLALIDCMRACRIADAPAPAATLSATNPMVHAVDLAHQQSQNTPQLSFGQVRSPCQGQPALL